MLQAAYRRCAGEPSTIAFLHPSPRRGPLLSPSPSNTCCPQRASDIARPALGSGTRSPSLQLLKPAGSKKKNPIKPKNPKPHTISQDLRGFGAEHLCAPTDVCICLSKGNRDGVFSSLCYFLFYFNSLPAFGASQDAGTGINTRRKKKKRNKKGGGQVGITTLHKDWEFRETHPGPLEPPARSGAGAGNWGFHTPQHCCVCGTQDPSQP